jgi:hypothetical protein
MSSGIRLTGGVAAFPAASRRLGCVTKRLLAQLRLRVDIKGKGVPECIDRMICTCQDSSRLRNVVGL